MSLPYLCHKKGTGRGDAVPNLVSNTEKPRVLFAVAGCFFFFCQNLVPDVLADAKFGLHRFGFTNLHLAAFVQKLLDQGVVGRGLWNL